jgi:acetamidase/formamidase
VLEVDILEVAHRGWGWSSIIPGLGFLKDRFSKPYLFHWTLEGDESRSMAPAVVPLRPFCGVMGVAPAEPGEFRTRPPGNFGGNMDVRDLCSGARLYLPVLNRGALFSAGDAHGAQGDGEICINGIECPSNVSLRFHLHKRKPLAAPLAESPAGRERFADTGAWIVVESSPDAAGAARAATSRMIDLLMSRWDFADVDAYVLCSAVMNLHFAQVVNEPLFTVTASIPKGVLPDQRLF